MNKTEYWQPELETMPREELQKLQVEKLRKSIAIALKSPFYKKRLGDLGITPESIQTVEDIRKIPFTTKQDLRENYPFGLVGGDMKDAIRIHSTSGTTGHPTVVTYSRHDIDSWANMIARDMYMVGCRDTDVFQNSSGYGMFTGGLGFQYGAEKLGATTVPAAAGSQRFIGIPGHQPARENAVSDRSMAPSVRCSPAGSAARTDPSVRDPLH